MVKISCLGCLTSGKMEELLKKLVIYAFGFIIMFAPQFVQVWASTCGRKGEAIKGKCDLMSLPNGFIDVIETLNLTNLPTQVFQNLPFKRQKSCAVVGLSVGLLKCKMGMEIDSSTVVFRMGFSPLRRFSEHVGSKVDVTLCRSSSCLQDTDQHGKLKDLYGFRKSKEYENAIVMLQERRNPPYGFWNRSGESNRLLELYADFGRISPSSGFSLSIDLLATRFCDSVAVFGIGGGLQRYHARIPKGDRVTRKEYKLRRQSMKRSHSQDVERHILQRLKREGHRLYFRTCKDFKHLSALHTKPI